MNLKKREIIVVLCTAARGGMRTVVESYQSTGLFETWNAKLIHTHNDGGIHVKLFYFIRALAIFSYLATFYHIKFIHNHSAMRGSFWRKNVFSSIARFFGIPVLLHLHGSEMQTFYNSSSIKKQRKISNILSKATTVIVLSKSWESFILNISPNAKVKIIYNFVTLPNIVEKKITSQELPINILFLGLLGKRKGVYDLIDAAEQLKLNGKNFNLLIGGNGEVDEVHDLVIKKELENCVEVLGWVGKEAKEQLLSKTDVYILPSYNEGLPMSVLEAMSWGIPVVSCNVGGIPELIRHRVDGYVINPGNVAEIQKVLTELIGSKSIREKYGESARQRIESKFSDIKIIPKLNNLFVKTSTK